MRELSADVEFFPPAPPAAIAAAEREVGKLPQVLKDFLFVTNGLVCRSFRMLSAFDPDRRKKTWESLQRFNDPAKTRALGSDPGLLRRFLVFADIGGGYAAWDRSRDSVWFEESHHDKLRETDFTLREFVETMVRKAE